ncbi:MAG: rhomboid family intramembrane serine protease [Hyphomicrobium sp.]
MFVPIGDENPLKSIPFQFATIALIVLNTLIFVFETVTGTSQAVTASFSIVPNELFAAIAPDGAPQISNDALPFSERATLLTYMFLHGDWMHLISNMLFLWVFGDNVEDAMGHARFLAFYLLCGVAAGLAHAAMMPESGDALIGASGAVSGVIAAYLMLHPRVSVWVLAFKFIPLRITAAWVLGFWIVLQVVMLVGADAGPTAWWAHVGGLIAGAALAPLLRRPGVPLFGR